MANKKALVVLVEGFEEAEAVIPVDILRRSEVEVVIAGVDDDIVEGAHGIAVKTDILLKDYKEMPDAIVLP
ncbi:MAG: DJ-1/PfpI family protein, partial [Candidatus Omnitrophica bacterium]|nr:DJ-1/PfpI family protein [Candidatus Omnitrophota bacterium]